MPRQETPLLRVDTIQVYTMADGQLGIRYDCHEHREGGWHAWYNPEPRWIIEVDATGAPGQLIDVRQEES